MPMPCTKPAVAGDELPFFDRCLSRREGGAVVKVWPVLEKRGLCHNSELEGKLNSFGNSEFALIPLKPRKYDDWWWQSKLLHAISTDAADQCNSESGEVGEICSSFAWCEVVFSVFISLT